MARAFVHHLHAAIPSTAGQLALHLKLAKLRLVVGISNRTGAKSIADRERNIIGSHDVADIVPVRVEEVFLVMREAPFCHNAATTGNDAGHARSGERHEAQKHAGMDREVVHTLLGLFDQSVAENFPSKLLRLPTHLLQSLINRNCADRNG